jgi:predicted lipoprotein with Yx(FWY)xxD motif
MNMQATRRILTFALMLVVPACGDGNNATPDAAPPPPADVAPPAPSFTLTTTPATLAPRLVDDQGRSLYFFAKDLMGATASVCPAALCPAIWIPVNVASPTVGTGLTATDFTNLGSQSAWKGRPLYRFANDTTATPTAGENVGPGLWFVASAYNLFLETVATVTPQATPAGTAPGAPFFTNGAGRSVYFFKNDTRALGATPAVNTCNTATNTACNAAWTPWAKPATVVGPSTVLPANITTTQVTFNGATVQQFVYKGWPLYFFNADTLPGQVAGDSYPNATAPMWHAINLTWDGAAILP